MHTITVGGNTHDASDEVEGTIVQADDGCDYEAIRGRWERFGAPWEEGKGGEVWEPTLRDAEVVEPSKKKVVKKLVQQKKPAARPLNGFSRFMKEALPQIALDHPGMPCKERMKLAGQMWQAMK